ncbi:hypothetical protein GCM10009574_025350 [Streptomyces asiaticus]|uniref:Uncharacterized protein n=3 Tax=Streptomyces TaxID=1883 RepID=A0ABN1NT47_9ACTN
MSIVGIEMAERTVLPEEELQGPHVKALTDAAGALVMVDNDLLSYRREKVRSTTESNILTVLAQENGSSARDTVHSLVVGTDLTAHHAGPP